jgi:hypothetical protein
MYGGDEWGAKRFIRRCNGRQVKLTRRRDGAKKIGQMRGSREDAMARRKSGKCADHAKTRCLPMLSWNTAREKLGPALPLMTYFSL